MGVKAMNWNSQTRKAILLAIALLAIAGTAFVSAGLTQPKPFDSVVLSDQWQCTRTAGILTVCTKKPG
jgi:hypothetical protein